MATHSSSAEKLQFICVEEGTSKIARIQIPHSSNAKQLRELLSTRKKIDPTMLFLDTKGYPVDTIDEESTMISDLTEPDKNVVKLLPSVNMIVPEKRLDSLHQRAELNFASVSSKAITFPDTSLISGATSSKSTEPIILATDLDLSAWKKIFSNCHLLCAIRLDQETPVSSTRPIMQFKSVGQSIPNFQVSDSSYIRAYTRRRKMDSSFVSNAHLEGGISFSSPFMGIGVNLSFTRTATTAAEERTIYSTCLFNHPRAVVELDLSYLEPATEFVNAIDHVLQQSPTKAKLKDVLAVYGHMYPRRIVLGGHLFHSEEHRITESIEESRIEGDVEARFRIAYSKQIPAHPTVDGERKSRNERSDHESSITFQAVGGDTLRCRNPTVWEETIVDPRLWRVIERTDYQPTLSLLSQEQQDTVAGKWCIIGTDLSKTPLFSGIFNYQNKPLEEKIKQGSSQSCVQLDQQHLVDQDMEIVIEQVILNGRCTKMSMGWNKITRLGASILAGALTHRSCVLETLCLSVNDLGDDGINLIFKALANNQSKLKNLDIGNNHVTEKGVGSIAETLKTNKTLTHLCLNGNPISDEGIRVLLDAIAKSNTTLEEMNLCNNSLITDASVDTLLHFIGHNRSLKYLRITGSGLSKASKDRVEHVSRIKGNLRIYASDWH